MFSLVMRLWVSLFPVKGCSLGPPHQESIRNSQNSRGTSHPVSRDTEAWYMARIMSVPPSPRYAGQTHDGCSAPSSALHTCRVRAAFGWLDGREEPYLLRYQ